MIRRLMLLAMLAIGMLVTIPATAANYSNASLRATQQMLKDKGYYDGAVDGIMGPKTRAALRRYQQENHLAGEGRFTRETAEHIGAVKRDNAEVADHFEAAGDAITSDYSKAGSKVASGTKEMVGEVKQGEITEGAKEFGKGVGGAAKSVAKGTANAAKSAARGVKDAFDGDKTEQEKTRTRTK